MYKIIIDINEKKRFVKNFDDMDIKYTIKNLTKVGGDIWIVENKVPRVIIERKTLNDFEQSTNSARKKRQVFQLQSLRKKFGCECFFLIEGDVYKKYKKNNKMLKKYKQSITNLNIRDKISVIITKNMKDTVNEIQRIIKSLPQKSKITSAEDEFIHKVVKNSTLNKTTYLKCVLCCIPGIGKKTADSLANEFKNVNTLVNHLQSKKEISTKLNKTQIKSLKELLN